MYNSKILKKIRISLYFSVVFIPIGLVNSGTLDDSLYYHIYEAYIRALNIDEGTVSARRVFSSNKNYEIHVMKLDEVNGKKRHNLLVKESNASNPLIYIDNPVETKVPNAYLTFEEFKKQLTDRVLVLRQQFVAKTSKAVSRLSLNLTKEKPLNKDRGTKKFKIVLDRLISLRDDKHQATATKSKSKDNKKTIAKITKTTSINNKKQVSNAIKIKSKEIDNQTALVTEVTKSPVFRIFTLETDAEKVNEETVTKSELTDKIKVTETINTVVMEATLESPTKTAVTEHPTEPEVTNESLKANPEPTPEIKNNPTTTRTTTEEIITKRTLGRPLVWDGSDEKPNEYE